MLNDLIRKLALRVVKDELEIEGYLTARVKRKGSDTWEELWTKPVKNTIVNGGLAQTVKLQGDGAANAFGWGAIGTGTTAPSNTDTALESEVDRQAASFSQETTTTTDDTGKYVTTHTAPAGGWNITEYVLANAASAGTIYNRVTFTAIGLSQGDQLEFTYKTQAKRST